MEAILKNKSLILALSCLLATSTNSGTNWEKDDLGNVSYAKLLVALMEKGHVDTTEQQRNLHGFASYGCADEVRQLLQRGVEFDEANDCCWKPKRTGPVTHY